MNNGFNIYVERVLYKVLCQGGTCYVYDQDRKLFLEVSDVETVDFLTKKIKEKQDEQKVCCNLQGCNRCKQSNASKE